MPNRIHSMPEKMDRLDTSCLLLSFLLVDLASNCVFILFTTKCLGVGNLHSSPEGFSELDG